MPDERPGWGDSYFLRMISVPERLEEVLAIVEDQAEERGMEAEMAMVQGAVVMLRMIMREPSDFQLLGNAVLDHKVSASVLLSVLASEDALVEAGIDIPERWDGRRG